jgi:hypothetical protein
MIELLALYLGSTDSTGPIIPNYKPDHCYAAESEFRPNTILITGIEGDMYKYKIVIDPEIKKYSWELENNIDTLEFVYDIEVDCP